MDQHQKNLEFLQSKYGVLNKDVEQADFLSQMKKYHSNEVSELINSYENEARRQLKISEELNDSLDDKISRCKEFYEKNKDTVPEQLSKLNELQDDLKKLVSENEEKKERDEELKNLVMSKDYQKLAKELRSIGSKISDINFFLIHHGITDFKTPN